MIRRTANNCCCGIALMVLIVAAMIGWSSYHLKPPTKNDAAQAQAYVESVHHILTDYSARIQEIEVNPKLKEAITAAQKHAEHIREMKQVVAAQNQCEKALRNLKAPSSLAEVQSAATAYMHDLGERYNQLETEVKRKDVPEMNTELKKLGEEAHGGIENVDRALRQVPHYKVGAKELQDYWDQFEKAVGG